MKNMTTISLVLVALAAAFAFASCDDGVIREVKFENYQEVITEDSVIYLKDRVVVFTNGGTVTEPVRSSYPLISTRVDNVQQINGNVCSCTVTRTYADGSVRTTTKEMDLPIAQVVYADGTEKFQPIYIPDGQIASSQWTPVRKPVREGWSSYQESEDSVFAEYSLIYEGGVEKIISFRVKTDEFKKIDYALASTERSFPELSRW